MIYRETLITLVRVMTSVMTLVSQKSILESAGMGTGQDADESMIKV